MPITDNKTLRSWKNFVVDFRQEFETKNRCPGSVDSLSLLLLGLAVQVAAEEPPTVSAAISESETIFAITKRCMPAKLSFELTNCAARYSEFFENVLNAIAKHSFADNPLALGYTYQFWRDGERKSAQADLQSASKSINKQNLIAFTQIYTPEWVVEFILANTILPLVSAADYSDSQISKWLIPSSVSQGEEQSKDVSTLDLIDPACGAGNFLALSFDALIELHSAAGRSTTESIAMMFESQLNGCDIDEIALSVCALSLVAKALRLEPDYVPTLKGLALAKPLEEPLLGSLSSRFPSTHPLMRKYDVVVTNPPYIGRKLISRELKALLKSQFPNSHQDLSTAFFERALTLLKPGGRTGLITQASIMFLPSYRLLRETILEQFQLISAVDAGPGVFPLQGGEKVNSAILIVENQTSKSLDANSLSIFFNLKAHQDKERELAQQIARSSERSPITIDPSTFRRFHGSAFSYFIPPAITALLANAKPLETIADIRQGLATTDNDRFVKFVWQVPEEELGSRWFPYAKGAGGQRFQSPIRHVVNWQDDGAEIKTEVARRYPYLKGNTAWVVKNESFYFKEGLCFSFVNTRGIAVRKLPADCIFDVGASAIFSDQNDFLLAYLNSSLMVALANSLNPTINYQVGDLKRLPVLDLPNRTKRKLAALASKCAADKAELDELLDPSSWFRFRTRHNFGHTIYSNVAESGFSFAEKQFLQRVKELKSSIQAAETEINELVITEVATLEGWNDVTIRNVREWIQSIASKQTDPDSHSNTAYDNELSERFIDNLIVKARLESVSTSQGNGMGLPYDVQRAIENRTGSQLPSYISEKVLPRVSKMFFGAPPAPFSA